jgi:hypothetical protein
MFSLLKNKKSLLCLLGFVGVLAMDFLPRSVRSNALWEQVGQRDYFLQLPGTLSVVPEVSGVFVAILILVACGVAFLVKRDSKHVRFWGLSGLSGLGLVVVLFSYLVDYLSRKYSQEIVPVEFTLFIQSAGMQIVLAFGVMASILLTVNAVQKRRMSSVLYLFGILAQYGFLLMWAAPVIIQSLLLCVQVIFNPS